MSREQHADEFVQRYSPFLYNEQEVQMEPISTAQVFFAFTKAHATSPGPDMWSLKDLRYMTWTAAGHLGTLYNIVEKGGEWPDQMCLSKASFLSKTSEDSVDIFDFRILTVTSVLYR
eukprot:9210090-Alexandrium_andersonii.AAC.1